MWCDCLWALRLSFVIPQLLSALFLSLISPLRLPLSTSFSVSSLVAVPCWAESNLNYVSQGPIPLLPAVGISGLLISYQPVIGLRSPSPSDIPQIYDTPDSLRGGWGGGGWVVAGCSSRLPANTLLNKMSSWPRKMPAAAHVSLLLQGGFSTSRQRRDYSIFQITQAARGPAGFYAPC